MSTSSRNTHLQFRYGQCLNDGCSKCKSKEIQEIPARKDFVCQECGKELREVQRPLSWWEKYGKTTSAAIAAVVVIGGGIAWFAFSGSEPKKPAESVAAPDSSVVAAPDTTAAQPQTAPQAEEKAPEAASQTEATPAPSTAAASAAKPTASSSKPVPAPQTNGASLKCGKYEGPMAGGKPNGIGGTITVTRSYSIDLKDGSGNSVSIEAGDRISNTKFKNGVLQQGQLIRSNGERKFLTGLSERL